MRMTLARFGQATLLRSVIAVLFLRGCLALVFALAAFFWPALTVETLAILFAVWVLLDGILSLLLALADLTQHVRWWGHLGEGALGLIIGLVTFFRSPITSPGRLCGLEELHHQRPSSRHDPRGVAVFLLAHHMPTGFVKGALAKTSGANPAVQGWYAWFLQHLVLPGSGFFSFLVTRGEEAVGLGLLLGVLTGIAAGFGVLMNLNYLLAGTVSVNPILGMIGLLLCFSWRVCGWIGVDRWLLPALGLPWKPGAWFRSRTIEVTAPLS